MSTNSKNLAGRLRFPPETKFDLELNWKINKFEKPD